VVEPEGEIHDLGWVESLAFASDDEACGELWDWSLEVADDDVDAIRMQLVFDVAIRVEGGARMRMDITHLQELVRDAVVQLGVHVGGAIRLRGAGEAER